MRAVDLVAHLAEIHGLPRRARHRPGQRRPVAGRAGRGALPGPGHDVDRPEAAGEAGRRPGPRPAPACCSTSRPTASTRSSATTCSRSSAASAPSTASTCCCRPTCSTRWSGCATPPSSSARARCWPPGPLDRAAGQRRRLGGRGGARHGAARRRPQRPPAPRVHADGRAGCASRASHRPTPIRDAVADLGLALVRLERRRLSLEDVFLEAGRVRRASTSTVTDVAR